MSSSIITDQLVNWLTKEWADTTSLIPPFFVELLVPSQEMERSCIFVRGVDSVSIKDFSIGFQKCPDSLVFSYNNCPCCVDMHVTNHGV